MGNWMAGRLWLRAGSFKVINGVQSWLVAPGQPDLECNGTTSISGSGPAHYPTQGIVLNLSYAVSYQYQGSGTPSGNWYVHVGRAYGLGNGGLGNSSGGVSWGCGGENYGSGDTGGVIDVDPPCPAIGPVTASLGPTILLYFAGPSMSASNSQISAIVPYAASIQLSISEFGPTQSP